MVTPALVCHTYPANARLVSPAPVPNVTLRPVPHCRLLGRQLPRPLPNTLFLRRG